MKKVKKAKYQSDSELTGIEGVSYIKQVVDTEEQYKDILKDAVITRTAISGSNIITEDITYNVVDIEADYDFPVYKYIIDEKEYFSNFKFANYVEIVNPEIIN